MLKESAGGGGGGGGEGGGDQPKTTKEKKKDGAAATPSLKDCANCGASEGTIPGITMHKPCSRCMCTFYCSVRCQKRHWKEGGHKHSCVPMEDRSVEKAKAAVEPTKKNNNAGAAATEDDEEDICAICQYPLSDEPSTKMPCSHVYHVACVEKLRSYDIKQVCPTCRVDLPPGRSRCSRRQCVGFGCFIAGTGRAMISRGVGSRVLMIVARLRRWCG